MITPLEKLKAKDRAMSRVQEIINRGDVNMARLLIMTSAATAMANFPQYGDDFDLHKPVWQVAEWQVAKVNRTIESKAGVLFEEGDYVFITEPDAGDMDFPADVYWSAWSVRNCCLTMLRKSDVSEI